MGSVAHQAPAHWLAPKSLARARVRQIPMLGKISSRDHYPALRVTFLDRWAGFFSRRF
jgi:hypothetical protein